ncbi:LamG domain-containing protein [Streptomyces sp. NBC_01092]|uniref:LamG domain-containing protein n=1 Tax=Streptomyces sp. NBC_01092 TaxID=2903748 RepID=UPI003864FFD7|nr:LamG domain-containing protein [Streptomyces sp. NBC_01092]
MLINLDSGGDAKPAAAATPQGDGKTNDAKDKDQGKGKGWWPTDDEGGKTAEDRAGSHPAQFQGGVSWITAPDGRALLFDGRTGFLDAGAPILDTATKDYSVAARVRLDDKGFRTAVSQDSAEASTFYLQYSGEDDRFAFSFFNARAVAADAGPAELGRWYHLAGTYSQADRTLRIYVDGKPAGSAVALNEQRTDGNLIIGRGKSFGKEADFWAGAIADVHVFQRALAPAEVASLAAEEPQ